MSDKGLKEDAAAEYLMNLLRMSRAGDFLPTISSIACELDMSVASVTAACNAISEMGYIKNVPLPGNSRRVLRTVSAIPGPEIVAPKRPESLSKRRTGEDIRGVNFSREYRATAYLYEAMEVMEEGDRLPTMQEVADRLLLPKSIVHEAYKRLVKKGLAKPYRPYGHFLVEKPPPDDPFFDVDGLREDIEELTKTTQVMKSRLAKLESSL